MEFNITKHTNHSMTIENENYLFRFLNYPFMEDEIHFICKTKGDNIPIFMANDTFFINLLGIIKDIYTLENIDDFFQLIENAKEALVALPGYYSMFKEERNSCSERGPESQ